MPGQNRQVEGRRRVRTVFFQRFDCVAEAGTTWVSENAVRWRLSSNLILQRPERQRADEGLGVFGRNRHAFRPRDWPDLLRPQFPKPSAGAGRR